MLAFRFRSQSMNKHMCEASSSCENFQLAICLHCNSRLCLSHLNEHNNVIHDRVQNASAEVESASQYVQETFREHRLNFAPALLAAEEWRRKQIEMIEQSYVIQMQSLELKQKMLDNTQELLLKQLERDARAVLEKLECQQNANLDILHAVQHTIESVRHEANQAVENYSFKQTTPEGSLFTGSAAKISPTEVRSHPPKEQSPVRAGNQNYARPIKRLVGLFNQTASIPRSKVTIDAFIRKRGRSFRVAVLISSYLTAWFQIARVKRKALMLNGHISTIQKYLSRRRGDHRSVFIGLQSFFVFTNTNRAQQYEMMAFFLQHFLDHHCIRQEHLIQWYEQDNNHDLGYEQARVLAIPVIESFARTQTVHQEQAASASHIKQEPSAVGSPREATLTNLAR